MGISSDYEKDATAAYVTDASYRSDPDQDPEYDAVFGKHEEGQVDYKSVGWYVFAEEGRWLLKLISLVLRIKATVIMLKTVRTYSTPIPPCLIADLPLVQIIALGVLAMPTVLSATGGVPGALIIVVIGTSRQ
jgi:hypothetical protein